MLPIPDTKRSNRFDGEQLIGRLDQRFAIVASSPGELKLPALALKWWDVDRDKPLVGALDVVSQLADCR